MRPNSLRGMTLTELLVVIGIIGVLASILLPTVKIVRVKAYQAACRAEIRDFETACRDFDEDFGFYPPDAFGTSNNTYVNRAGNRVNQGLSPLLKGCPMRSDILLTPDDISGPENSSVLMVFFLGSEFTIGGKSYGPYCEFQKEQLDPHPDDSNWEGSRYPAYGLADGSSRSYSSYGVRSTSRTPIPWEIKGVDDDNPGTDVRLFRYLDKFGPARRDDPSYFDYYVYDCHNPEGWSTYGPEPQPPDHNVDFVDISCYGLDGNTSINVAEEGGEGSGDPGTDEPEDDDVGGTRGKELRGMWKDDINNWTAANEWPRRWSRVQE